jgi:hypothetical protein
MKNVFKVLGVLALVGLLMSCFPPAPIVPASVALVGNEGVDETIFKLRFTAQGSSGQVYAVKKAGITEEALVNLTYNGASVVSPRIGLISVVTCDPVVPSDGLGCFQVTLPSRTTGTKNAAGSVSFKLDGVALSLPFTHAFANPAP